MRHTPCCGYQWAIDSDNPRGPIFWNEFNKAVQCHNCGQAFETRSPLRSETPGDGLKHTDDCAVQDTDIDCEGICTCGAYARQRVAIQTVNTDGGWVELPSALMKDDKLWATGKHFVWLPDGSYIGGKRVEAMKEGESK